MAGEGDVDERVASEFLRCVDYKIAAGDEICVDRKVCDRRDNVRVFVSFACEAKDVRAFFLDAAETFSGSRDRLVDYDDFHVRVISKSCYLCDGGFHLRHEVVGVGQMLDHSAC